MKCAKDGQQHWAGFINMRAHSRTQSTCPTYIVGVLMTWLVLSVTMVVLNQWILTQTIFRLPVALSFCHMVSATVMTLALQGTHVHHQTSTHHLFAYMGIGILFAASLTSGMAAMLYIPVSTIQMLKMLGPALSFVLGLLSGVEKFSCLYGCKIAAICIGVGVASHADSLFDPTGFTLQVLSIICDGVRCTLLQVLLQKQKAHMTPLRALSILAPCTMVALLLPLAVVEIPAARLTMSSPRECVRAAMAVLCSCCLATALNLVIIQIVTITSALTASVSSIAKVCRS
jgi:Triose-phosphate Transporter family